MLRLLAMSFALILVAISATALLTPVCDHWGPYSVTQTSGAFAMAFALRTDVFAPGGEIPPKYTCTGTDVSPQLTWTDLPAGTQTLALIVDDPDAPSGTFTHWVLYNLSPQEKELREGVPRTEQLPGGGLQGRNGFGKIGYGGPCPPPGKSHRYYFKLYALDTKLNLKPGAAKSDVEQAMKGHILGQAELMGMFKR